MWVRCAVVAAALVCGAGSAGCGGRPATSTDVPPNQHDLWAVDSSNGRLKDLTRTKADELAPAFSPDGEQIAYYGGFYGRGGLYVMDAEGGAQRRIARGHAAVEAGDVLRPPAWAPDGTRIAWATARGCDFGCEAWEVWTVGVDGSNPTLVAARAGSPVWSPDGKEIAYSGDLDAEGLGGTIYVADADGGNPRPVAMGGSPSWSSTGSISYLRAGALFVSRPDGGPERRVATGELGLRVAWAQDGSGLAFERRLWNGDVELFSVAADGLDLTRLTRRPGDDGLLAWEPGGKRIVWLHRDVLAAANPGYDLMTSDTRGFGAQRLLDVSLAGARDPPAWSPDGRTIVLSVLPPQSKRDPIAIWKIDVATGKAGPLSGAEGDAEPPSLSPEGRQLAFYETDEAGTYLWTSDLDGGYRQRIGPGGVNGLYERSKAPAWSPDGRTIAYARGDGCEDDYCDTPEVWLAPLGGEPRRLTTGRDPSWSPDGKRVAFADGPIAFLNEWFIAVIGADGRNRRVLARGGESPDWSPQSELIAYIDKDGWLSTVAASGSGRHRLAYLEREDFAWSPDGASIVLSGLRSVSPTGGKKVPLTRLKGGGESPAFSRDGRIAWLNVPYLEGDQTDDIYVSKADGTEARRVTRKRQVIVDAPVWSADGRTLFYVPWPHLIG
jgi:Tol biopolymer transport system component